MNPYRSLVLVFAIFLSLVLSSCTKTSSAPKLFVPSFCDRTSILAALPTSLTGAKWIDTQWEPAKGTDLDAALSEGGLA